MPVLNRNLLNSTALSLLCCFANSLHASDSDLQDPIEIVKTIVATNCIRCHAGQGPGPFTLLTDGDLARHGPTMVAAVESGLMPPWLPIGERGIFRDDCRLSATEIAAFTLWKTQGFPTKKNAREKLTPATSAIAPSLSVDVARDWIPNPEDPESLRSFATVIGNGKPLHIRGWKITRDSPTLAVRYNLLTCDGPEALALDHSDPAPGFFGLGDRQNKISGSAGAIGVDSEFQLPAGFAFALPAKATLVTEVLSSGRGRPESAGAIFQMIPALETDRIVKDFSVIPDRSAPAQRTNQIVSVTTEALSEPLDLIAIVIRPDMRARSVEIHVISESGAKESLLNIPRYLPILDRGYVMKKPLLLEAGDRIHFAVKYDDDARARRSAPVAVLLTAVPIMDNASVAGTPIQPVAPTSIEKFCEGAAAKSIGIEMLPVESSSAFRLAKTEITQRQFAAILKRNPTAFAVIDPNLERPADSISWYDAAEFCNALSQIEGLPPRYLLHGIVRDSQGCIDSARAEITTSHGYRLPRESEWLEASCSKTNVLSIDAATIERSAWLTPWANNISHQVATKAPNEFGFHDLFGNVWEWCEDAWIDPQTSGPIARVVRGGAWCDGVAATTCDFRSGVSAGTRNSPFGFRIAVDAHPPTSNR